MSKNENNTLDYATPARRRRPRWVVLMWAAAAAVLLGLFASRSIIVGVQRQRAEQAQRAVLKAIQAAAAQAASKPVRP